MKDKTICKGFRKHDYYWKYCNDPNCLVDHMAAFYMGWVCGDPTCKNCGKINPELGYKANYA